MIDLQGDRVDPAVNSRELQLEYEHLLQAKLRTEAQLKENLLVQDEFKNLKKEDITYKLVGPILVKQELEDAVTSVDKRIEFIQGELKKIKAKIDEIVPKLRAWNTQATSEKAWKAPAPTQV